MNVFDILGPVMIGPSSSHTAGAARIGRITLAGSAGRKGGHFPPRLFRKDL
jgi:L-serine deaminase